MAIMKRDMDVIRAIILNVEGDKYPYGGRVNLPGVSEETCAYHVALMIDAGLVEGHVIKSISCPYAAAGIERLTSAGHDFCDGIKHDTIWNKAKGLAGSLGLPVVVECVKVEARRLVFGA
jgi:hypothetical protein